MNEQRKKQGIKPKEFLKYHIHIYIIHSEAPYLS